MIGSFYSIVEVDEACFGRRKYHKGKYSRSNIWVFGGIERGSNKFFVEIVKNRTKKELTRVIKKYINLNSFIFSDEWKGYYGLNLIGYHHYTVNYSKAFRNKSSGVHTNTIEGFWNILRDIVPNISTRNKKKYFIEFMWRKSIGDLDVFEELIKIIQYYYYQQAKATRTT
jgi:transposase-like protein